MSTYTVTWTATTYYTQTIEADSEQDAKNKAFDQPIEYDYTSGVRHLESIKEQA